MIPFNQRTIDAKSLKYRGRKQIKKRREPKPPPVEENIIDKALAFMRATISGSFDVYVRHGHLPLVTLTRQRGSTTSKVHYSSKLGTKGYFISIGNYGTADNYMFFSPDHLSVGVQQACELAQQHRELLNKFKGVRNEWRNYP